jgi:predicted AAA+ superfamily ATPase
MRRKLFEDLYNHLKKDETTIVIGARQTGKSTLLRDLESECKKEKFSTVFINLENKDLLAALNLSPLNLLAFAPNPGEKTIFFLDEIQYLNDPSNFIKLLFDEHRSKVKLVASGSSAFYLDQKFKDSLVGRKRIFRLNTCDFEEFLLLQEKHDLWEEVLKIKKNPGFKSIKITFLKSELEKFLIFGGYPAVAREANDAEKRLVLKDIRDSFIKRDILESGVKNEPVFFSLFKILAEQTGQLININELSNTLRVRSETIQNYLRIMQTCFHIETVRPFYQNLRKELMKMPKMYFMDTGLRNSLLNNFQPISQRLDRGELWENAIFRALADKYEPEEIRFWRTVDGKEVDFVLPEIDVPIALEAKFDGQLIKPAKYKLFQEAYPEIGFQFASFSPWSEEVIRRYF